MNPEKKFWYEIKAFNLKNNCELSFTRVENSAAHGTPDLLVYNTSGHFFTIELKLNLVKKIRFSPHQIGFHIKHPHNSFIMAKGLCQRDIKLYEGSKIRDLVSGHAEPCATGMMSSFKFLQKV